VLTIHDDAGEVEDRTHGLRFGESVEEHWQIAPADPLSARAKIIWEQRLSRGDWSVRTRAETQMTGTATELRMTARLTAWEGEMQVFDRVWDDSVPRRFV
jgi:hypothetical protein